MSGLSLESLMAIAQSASSAAARRAQQAQQAQAQQAQQQQNQQGVNGAQQGQQTQQQPQMSTQDLEAAQERNSAAGETWGEFKSDTPVEQNKATAENQNREDLYKDLGAAKAAVPCPTSDNAADTAAKDALKKPTAIETAAKDIKQPSTTTAVDAAAKEAIKNPAVTTAVQAAAKEAIKNPAVTTAADAAAKEAIKQPNTTSAVEAAAQALGSNAGAAAAAAGAATANPVQAAASTTTPAQTPAATSTPAQTPTETPAASPTPAATPAATPAQTPASQPQFKTNQDLINYAYKQGGGTWEGASRVAREHGTSLNALVRDRNGTPPVSSPRTGGTESAPGTSPSTPGTDANRGTGANRSIKGYRDVDVNKLAEQLPPQAKHLAQAFVDSGKKHNVDPIALAAIAKHETGNFTSSAFRNKNNAMGVSDANGPIHQASHEASIDKMAKLLGSTTSGPYKNASSVAEIGRIYAPVGAGNDPTGLNNHWTRGVSNFADDLEKKVVGSSSPAATNASSTNASSSAPSTSSTAPSARPQGTGSTTTSGANAANETPATTSGANGTARIERTKNAGARNQMVEGTITVNGNSYPFRSGGHGRGSLPTGTYTVERHLDSRSDRSMSVGGVGYSFAVSDKYDPRVGATRQLLRIHPDGGSAGTEGCIGIVGDAATQRRFRDDMLAEIRRNGGRYTLTVG